MKWFVIFAGIALSACGGQAKKGIDGELSKASMSGSFHQSQGLSKLQDDPSYNSACANAGVEGAKLDPRLVSTAQFTMDTKVQTGNSQRQVSDRRTLTRARDGAVAFQIDILSASNFSFGDVSIAPGSKFTGRCGDGAQGSYELNCTTPYYDFLAGAQFAQGSCQVMGVTGDVTVTAAGAGTFTLAKGHQMIQAWAESKTQRTMVACGGGRVQLEGTRKTTTVYAKDLANPMLVQSCAPPVFEAVEDQVASTSSGASPSTFHKASRELVDYQ